MLKVSALVTTLNEADNLVRCLGALKDFDEIIVIDSGSLDGTCDIARRFGARVESFAWNGQYPKKRQWCLDNLEMKNEWIFFVDGDEEVTPALIAEIKALDFSVVGYFVKGQYMWRGRALKHGLRNNKLVLFNRYKIEFPLIDDLNIEGMGEMEGHYQPVLKPVFQGEKIGRLQNPMIHFAYENAAQWQARHDRYARWEAQMIMRQAYPKDPSYLREIMKNIFRKAPARGVVAFVHSYILKLGFLDGVAGYQFAMSRMEYYNKVSDFLKTNRP